MQKINLKTQSKILILILLILSIQVVGLFMFDLVKVNERQVAVITRFGKIQNTYTAGWHFKLPWVDRVATVYQLDTQSISTNSSAATRDQQSLDLLINVQFRIIPTEVSKLYRSVRDQSFLNQSITPPLIQQAVKSTTAQFSAAELLEKRSEVKIQIEENLRELVKPYSLDIVAVNLENIDFSESFDKAIEAKVVAEQEVQRSRQELEKAKINVEIEKQKALVVAEQGKALRENPEVLELEKVKKWDGKLPRVQGNNDLMINLDNLEN